MERFRLAWDLSEVAGFVARFRSAHEKTQDTDQAAPLLDYYLRLHDRWQHLL